MEDKNSPMRAVIVTADESRYRTAADALASVPDIVVSRAEPDFRERDARFEAIFEASDLGMAEVGPDGALLRANPALRTILGCPDESLPGTPLQELFVADDWSRESGALQTALSGKAPVRRLVLRAARRDGVPVGVKLSLIPVAADGESQGWIAVIEAFRSRRESEESVYLAQYDAVTGLPNRNLFWDRLEQALARAERHQEILTLLFVDLDDFRRVNESLGQEAGDKVLAEVAQRLLQNVRKSDTVARFAGDAFMVLTEVAQREDAAAVAQKFLDAMAAPFQVGDRPTALTASIGVALHDWCDDAYTLIRHADIAAYAAKAAGRGACRFYMETSVGKEQTA